MAATAFPTPDPIAQLLLLAVFVPTPLAIAVTATPSRAGRDPLAFRAALTLQPFAAVSLAASYLAPAGAWAALLALPWLLVTLCAALFGLTRLLPRPTRAVEETCLDVGLLYFALGGGWVLLSRLGARPLEFGETIVLLTAVHFHYAGPLASIIAGMTGRQLRRTALAPSKLYRFSAIGVMLSPAVLAVGISFWSLLEAAAALALAASLIALAIVTVRLSPTVPSQLARALLRISAAASVVAMLFAAGYGLVQGLHLATVSLPTMVRVHGWLNAVGFALCGLLGWTLATPNSSLPHPAPPFSRLASRGRIGADYFDRTAVVRPGERQPTGLVDSLDTYRRPDFEPDRVHPAI